MAIDAARSWSQSSVGMFLAYMLEFSGRPGVEIGPCRFLVYRWKMAPYTKLPSQFTAKSSRMIHFLWLGRVVDG